MYFVSDNVRFSIENISTDNNRGREKDQKAEQTLSFPNFGFDKGCSRTHSTNLRLLLVLVS